MEKKFNKVSYNNEYNEKNYDRINLTVPKGRKELLKKHADRFDEGSVNGFINRAISEQLMRDIEGE